MPREEGEVDIIVYHLKPFESREFKLVGDPYESVEAQTQLQDMKVVHYRDEDHAIGLVLLPHTEMPVQAYVSRCMLDADTNEVAEWDESIPMSQRVDHKAWIQFNKQGILLAIEEGLVKFR